MTDGGLGCALLWPFSNERFFAPWTPLPVAPIGRAFLSWEGLRVAAVESIALLPFLIYGLWPARARAPLR
jgi:inner membrane protein